MKKNIGQKLALYPTPATVVGTVGEEGKVNWLLFMAVLVPLWGLDGVWLLHFVAGVFSAAAAIFIVRRVRLQAPPSTPPVASFFQPTLSLDFIRPFLAMPKLKQVWLNENVQLS